MITVACVLKSGGDYDAEYVKRLKDGVDKHLSGHQFVCLSDVEVPCERITLDRGLPGWWSKVEVFRLTGKVLYLDLDTVVCGDISEIANYDHSFTMLSDFYKPERPASGIMAWNGDYSFMNDEYDPQKQYPGHGDQGYIASKVTPDRFQDLFPGQVTSRKAKHTRTRNERIVCFHGRPRPRDVGWKI